MARNEIDAQAEALRFIHNNALTDIGGSGNGSEVWNKIVTKANNPSEAIINPTINECKEVYQNTNTLVNQKAFIINTRKLNTGDPNEIIIAADSNKTFEPAATYPRIIYSNGSNDNTLIGQDTVSTISKVQGIYIVAVKNSKSTYIVKGNQTKLESAYYDFYIRTCWYASNSSAPTTISTVVRLYNPDIATDGITPNYDPNAFYDEIKLMSASKLSNNGAPEYTVDDPSTKKIYTGSTGVFPIPGKPAPTGYQFVAWCTKKPTAADNSCTGDRYEANVTEYSVPPGYTSNNEKIKFSTLYAIYKPNPTVYVAYNKNGGSGNNMSNSSGKGGTTIELKRNTYTKTAHTFIGWCVNKTSCAAKDMLTEPSSGKIKYKLPAPDVETTITLYAQWKSNPDTITFNCGNGTTATQSFTSTAALNKWNTMCSYPNYTFNNWKGSNGKTYGDGANYTYVGGKSVTLTAQYTANCNFSSQTFEYSASVVEWRVPKGCGGNYTIEAWGAQAADISFGGDYWYSNNASATHFGAQVLYRIGGKGGYARGTIYLKENTPLYIAVGGKPCDNLYDGNYHNPCGGGWNGGGGATHSFGSPGGGASHVATTKRGSGNLAGLLINYGSQELQKEVLVAAGGGGGGGLVPFGWRNNDDLQNKVKSNIGGNGGGNSGQNGQQFLENYGLHYGRGGTQTSGGSTNGVTGCQGAFGQGAMCKSGGGGGWYGGGAGEDYNGASASGGGSSHVNSSMSNGTTDTTNRLNSGNGKVIITKN